MAAELIKKHASQKISHIFLSHISENDNTPALAIRTFNKIVREREDLLFETHLTSARKVSHIVEINESSNHPSLGIEKPFINVTTREGIL